MNFGKFSSRHVALVGLVAIGGAGLGTPSANAQVQQAGTIFAFGDSLLDTRVFCKLLQYPNNGAGTCGNGPNVVQQLPSVTKYTFNSANDYAVGGSGTGNEAVLPGVSGQVAQFQATGGRIGPNDLVVLSGAGNNHSALFDPAVTPLGLAQQALTEQRNSVAQLIGLGASNIVVYSTGGAGATQAYNQGGYYNFGNPQPIATAPGASTYFTAYDAGLAPALTPFANANTHIRILDYGALGAQIQADPGRYGFSTALPCRIDPGCIAGSRAFQDQHFQFDVHPTEAGYLLTAKYIANLLSSGFGLAAQANLANIDAINFNNSIMTRLDHDHVGIAQANANAMAADFPTKAKSRAPLPQVGKWSIYADGYFASGSQADSANASGFKYTTGGGGIGGEFRLNLNTLYGLAFNYSQPNATLNNGSGTIKLDTYQFAGYASTSYRNWFADAVLSGGFNNFHVVRPGVVDSITGSPDGTVFTFGAKAGYLFDVAPALQVGPIVGLTYARVHIDAYSEAGDFVLTQRVMSQDLDGLTGRAGVQLRYSTFWNGRVVMPYLNVTAEHDFLSGARILNSIALDPVAAVPVFTAVSNPQETYGRVAAGIAADIAQNVSLAGDVQSTFARKGGNDFLVSGKLSYRF
jgi:outer membrane lipase/esterase